MKQSIKIHVHPLSKKRICGEQLDKGTRVQVGDWIEGKYKWIQCTTKEVRGIVNGRKAVRPITPPAR